MEQQKKRHRDEQEAAGEERLNNQVENKIKMFLEEVQKLQTTKERWHRRLNIKTSYPDPAAIVDDSGSPRTQRKGINLNKADHVEMSDTVTTVAAMSRTIKQGGNRRKLIGNNKMKQEQEGN